MAVPVRSTPTRSNYGGTIGENEYAEAVTAQVENLWKHAVGSLTGVGGTANAITCSADVTLLAYTLGLTFWLTPLYNNTGAATINIDSVGVKSFKDSSGDALPQGGLLQGVPVLIFYDGTDFRVLRNRRSFLADKTFYVRTDGSDSNNGEADTSAGAFLTIQAAVNYLYRCVNMNGYTATVQVRTGTYAPVEIAGVMGHGKLRITGDLTTPSNVVIAATTSLTNAISVSDQAQVLLGGLKLTATNGIGLSLTRQSFAWCDGLMEYGACSTAHFSVFQGSFLRCNAHYTISGNSAIFLTMGNNGVFISPSRTITLTGSPTWTTIVSISHCSTANLSTSTFSGAAGGGTNYSVVSNSVFILGVTVLPGTGGSTAIGGQVV